MPYTGPGDRELPDYVQELPEDKRAQWVEVFNSAIARCEEENGENCEAAAFAQANGVVMKEAILAEAATLKAQAQRLMRDMTAILADRAVPDSLRKEIEDVRTALRRTWADLEADGAGMEDEEPEMEEEPEVIEAERGGTIYKTVAGEMIPADSFLVIEDPEMPTTWHLQVRDAQGNPDHRLMGAAYAALTVGYRGNRYEGPNKQEAMRKLRALYNSEEMAWPGDQAEAFKDAVLHLFAEMFGEDMAEDGETQAEAAPPQEQQATLPEPLAESAAGVALLSEGAVVENGQGPLTMRVQLIEPGFGNKVDNHYYPRDVVRRDARIFIGSKMFETDHKQGEKSTRTWVSTVRDIVGFSDTGAPLAEVVVHDPSFAQRVRNLNKEQLLDRMECSIQASGTVRRGTIDGRDTKIVEAITDASSVDWVTRAGAGGKALALVESESGGQNMEESQEELQEEQQEVPAPEAEPVQEKLSEAEIQAVLNEAQVNEAIKERLAGGQYTTPEALREAIASEVAYLKKVTGSGKVTGLGESEKTKPERVSLEEVQRRQTAVNQKWGFTPVREQPKMKEAR